MNTTSSLNFSWLLLARCGGTVHRWWETRIYPSRHCHPLCTGQQHKAWGKCFVPGSWWWVFAFPSASKTWSQQTHLELAVSYTMKLWHSLFKPYTCSKSRDWRSLKPLPEVISYMIIHTQSLIPNPQRPVGVCWLTTWKWLPRDSPKINYVPDLLRL